MGSNTLVKPYSVRLGYYHQAGATAYLIDPAGTYSLAGASAPTIDLAAASVDPATSAHKPAAAETHIPVRPATAGAAKIIDGADAGGLDSLAGASDPTLIRWSCTGFRSRAQSWAQWKRIFRSVGQPPLRRRLLILSALTVRRDRARRQPVRLARTAVKVRRAHPRGSGNVYSGRAAALRRRSSSPPALTTPPTRARRRMIQPALTAPSAPARRWPTRRVRRANFPASPDAINPHGAPAGYYYQAGATAYIEDPAGTYSHAGQTTPTADPGGYYSRPGASAPTRGPGRHL